MNGNPYHQSSVQNHSYSVESALLYVLGATYNSGVTIYTVIKFRKGEAVH